MADCLTLKSFAVVCKRAYTKLTRLDGLSSTELVRATQLAKSLKRLSRIDDTLNVFDIRSQRKTKRRLQSRLSADIWSDRHARMTCSLYWYSLKDPALRFMRSLKNYVMNCNERLSCAYPLHKAVFERDLVTLSHLCTGEDRHWIYVDLELTDQLGNTPLMLAVKLDYLEEATVLLDFGADPNNSPELSELTPYEHAIGSCQKVLLTRILAAVNRQKLAVWEIQRKVSLSQELARILKKVPDFSLKIGWQCESNFIPFLKRFAPSDEYQIYKRGQDFRVDLSLIGVNKLKNVRGKLSLMFKDRELKLVDHERGRVKDLMAEPNDSKLEAEAESILRSKKFSKDYKPTNFKFMQAKDWRGNAVVSDIGNWSATKYNASCQMNTSLVKKPVFLDDHLQTLKTFQDYLEYANLKEHRPSNSIVTLSPRSSKNLTKNLKATIWASPDFPLNIKSLMPIVELMSTVSKKAKVLKELLEANEFPMTIGFPVKIVFPLFWAVKAVATFTDFDQTSVDPELFDCALKTEEVDLDLYHEEELFSQLSEVEAGSDVLYSEESTDRLQVDYDEASENEEELARAHEVFMTLSSNSNDENYSEIFAEDSANLGNYRDAEDFQGFPSADCKLQDNWKGDNAISCIQEPSHFVPEPHGLDHATSLSWWTLDHMSSEEDMSSSLLRQAEANAPRGHRGRIRLDAEFVLSRLKERGEKPVGRLDVDVDI